MIGGPETPPEPESTEPFDFSGVIVTESDEIVTPKPEGESNGKPIGEKDGESLTPAERVARAMRFGRKDRSGERPGEPSPGESAPRSSRGRSRGDTPPKPREGTLVKPLTDLYTSIGLALAPFDPVCSTALITNAEECARSVEKLARENPAVRRVVMRLLETSAWGGVMIAHLPILAIVMTHHGPESVKERAAPLGMFLNPAAMEAMRNAQATPDVIHDRHLREGVQILTANCPVCGVSPDDKSRQRGNG